MEYFEFKRFQMCAPETWIPFQLCCHAVTFSPTRISGAFWIQIQIRIFIFLYRNILNGVQWHYSELKFIKIFAELVKWNDKNRVQNQPKWTRQEKIHYHRTIRKWFADFNVILYYWWRFQYTKCSINYYRTFLVTINQLKIKWALEQYFRFVWINKWCS